MVLKVLTTALLAVILPAPSASPASSDQRQLPTIIIVTSSPYCNSLADHFNGAMAPMLANDRVLESTSVQLDNLNTLFDHPNYIQAFVNTRTQIGKEQAVLMDSMNAIAVQIAQLRAGARLTTDPQATAQINQASWELQAAYDHQRQLAIDLQNFHNAMMRYPIFSTNPTLGGFNQYEMMTPADMQNVKVYLHFDSQRSTIAQNEDKAVDIAYNAAETYCGPKK